MNDRAARSGVDVHIVMAAYNGSEYLDEQLASIRGQSFSDWVMWIRDDGSSDRTCAIIRRHALEDARIHLIEDSNGNLGPSANFSLLLQHAHAAGGRYFFLSDQDDVWVNNKLERSLALMFAAEGRTNGQALPMAVFSDLEVVDGRLGRIHRSFMRYEMLRPAKLPLQVLLVQNFVTGCTLLLNRPLLEFALPIPSRVMMHDWWLALCAAAVGELKYLPIATVRYRQHGNNQVGAQGYWRRAFPILTIFGRRRKGVRLGDFVRSVCQAQSLLRRLSERSANPSLDKRLLLVRGYCELFEQSMGGVERAKSVFSLGIHRQGIPRNIFLLLQTVLWARKSRQMRSAQSGNAC